MEDIKYKVKKYIEIRKHNDNYIRKSNRFYLLSFKIRFYD